MRILHCVFKLSCFLAAVLIALAGLYAPLVCPPDFQPGHEKYDIEQNHSTPYVGTRGCPVLGETTYWIDIHHMAIRPEGFTGTFEELRESGLEYEKLTGIDKDETRDIIHWTSRLGRESHVDTGRLMSEVAFFAGALLVFMQLACWTRPKTAENE